MKVYAFESAGWADATKHGITKERARKSLEDSLDAVQKLLPTLSGNLTVAVRPYFRGIVSEYGTGGRTHDAEFIEIWLDKTIPYGPERMLNSLRQTIFHEANHAARWNSIAKDFRLVEGAVFEGLATVFEREYASHQPPYGTYEDDKTMQKWFAEIKAAEKDWSKREALFFTNPDGRRWIGYKTGTWLIDRAIQKSGKTVIDLTTSSADDIIARAELPA